VIVENSTNMNKTNKHLISNTRTLKRSQDMVLEIHSWFGPCIQIWQVKVVNSIPFWIHNVEYENVFIHRDFL